MQKFTASTWQEDGLVVAQCLEVDVASQGETEEEAISNLKEALELHFSVPVATAIPHLIEIEIQTGAA